jgi:pantetheine-phosphate adenylyltransferase
MTTVAVYAGSFDPITNGHLWVIQEGLRLFDRLIVAVGNNPAKKGMFTPRERRELIARSARDLPGGTLEVVEFGGLMMGMAMYYEATHVLRGVRSAADFEAEIQMRHVNEDIAEEYRKRHDPEAATPTTVFVSPPRHLVEVSSSMVKGLLQVPRDEWEPIVRRMVPPFVFEVLQRAAS